VNQFLCDAEASLSAHVKLTLMTQLQWMIHLHMQCRASVHMHMHIICTICIVCNTMLASAAGTAQGCQCTIPRLPVHDPKVASAHEGRQRTLPRLPVHQPRLARLTVLQISDALESARHAVFSALTQCQQLMVDYFPRPPLAAQAALYLVCCKRAISHPRHQLCTSTQVQDNEVHGCHGRAVARRV